MTTTPGTGDRQAILDTERALNEQYLRAMEALLERAPNLIKQVAVTQSAIWNNAGPTAGIGRGAVSPIIGRVALNIDDELLGGGFYIAGWHHEQGDFQAVSWAAPVAQLFFEGRSSSYELAHAVTGRRTFVLRLDDLVDYDDEVAVKGETPFAAQARVLEVPAAPRRRERPSAKPSEKVEDLVENREDYHEVSVEPEEVVLARNGDEVPATSDDVVSSLDGALGELPPVSINDLDHIAPLARDEELRAGLAVAKVMEMPKTGRLASVLATLQPDQYRLVSWRHNRPLIVQGQPGTGKTVIATHRAAFITHDERGADRIARVALIGPSDQYVDHVTPLVSEIKDPRAQVRVLSLPSYLQRVAGLSGAPKAGPAGLMESTWELGRAVDQAIRAMPSKPTGRIDKKVRAVAELLKGADATTFPEPDILTFVRGLPKWPELSTQARYVPLLATIALALDPSQNGGWVGHLIVDEAQDVSPIEWRLLTTSLLDDGGGLTLFGDLNQRRSDWSASSWERLGADLEMTDDNGETPLEVMTNGYRSTRQILRFANKLLPQGARKEYALRQGTPPDLIKTTADGAPKSTVEAAIGLTSRHQGLVAVITLQPRAITTELRQRSWSGARHNRWTNGTETIVVLQPDEARGLEFDGVVVLEPADFPENVGRLGPLYTSLTRANKELAVVHTKPLPKDLR